MITAEQIRDILAQYRKHGWHLRRVLLSPQTRETLKLEEIFGQAETRAAKIDAAWFSRISKNGREAWELRHLNANPFALLETFGPEDDETDRRQLQREMEERLENHTAGTDH